MLEVLMGLTTSLPYMGARTLKPQKPTLQIFLGAREFRLLYVPDMNTYLPKNLDFCRLTSFLYE